MSSAFARWVNSPTGPKTTHFWGPVANWGFVAAVRGVFHRRLRVMSRVFSTFFFLVIFSVSHRRRVGRLSLFAIVILWYRATRITHTHIVRL